MYASKGEKEHSSCCVYCNEKPDFHVTEGTTTMHLKVVKISKEPSPVYDHQVPIFIEEQHMFRSEQWDLTTYQVILRWQRKS
jgi:hypothetical protein